jgi:uncharacterized protein
MVSRQGETKGPAFHPGLAPIEAYGNGGFRFAGMSHRGSLLLLPSGIRAWDAAAIEDLTPLSIEIVLAEAASGSLLLLGSGRMVAFPPGEARLALDNAGIAYEVMDTGAACRTFNVLLGEGRPVAAALIAVD